MTGADLLGYYFRIWLKIGNSVDNAFRMAKLQLKFVKRFLPAHEQLAVEDALLFNLWKQRPDLSRKKLL